VGSFTLSNPGITETLIRTRGRFTVVTDAPIASEDQVGAWGMVVVNDLALAAGAASIPGPATDASDDGWFVWEGFNLVQASVGATAVTVEGTQMEFDSKAARRVEEGFSIAIMAENSSLTDAFNFYLALSLLSKINT